MDTFSSFQYDLMKVAQDIALYGKKWVFSVLKELVTVALLI